MSYAIIKKITNGKEDDKESKQLTDGKEDDNTKEIEINTKEATLPSGLNNINWSLNSGLNVITGLNGSGKIKLLKYIYDNCKQKCEIRYIDVDYKPPIFRYKNEVDFEFSKNENGEIMHHGKIDPQGSINQSFISNIYLPHIDKDILNDIMTIRGNFLTQRGGLSEEVAEKTGMI